MDDMPSAAQCLHEIDQDNGDLSSVPIDAHAVGVDGT
jgi:hypothetical protein